MSTSTTAEIPAPDNSRKPVFVMASFRLTPDTHTAIRRMAELENVTQSQIMRSAVNLLEHTKSLPENVKLATVDVNDAKPGSYFKLKEWILSQ